MEKKKFALYESGIVQTLIRSMYGNLVYFLQITTLTQFFKKSVELLGCYRNCDILFPLAHLFPFITLSQHPIFDTVLLYGVKQANHNLSNFQSFRNALFALFTLLNRVIMPFLSLSIQKYYQLTFSIISYQQKQCLT